MSFALWKARTEVPCLIQRAAAKGYRFDCSETSLSAISPEADARWILACVNAYRWQRLNNEPLREIYYLARLAKAARTELFALAKRIRVGIQGSWSSCKSAFRLFGRANRES